MDQREAIFLNGNDLTVNQLVSLSTGNYRIELTQDAWDVVSQSREVVDNIVNEGRVVYGVNTGFGQFANVLINPENLADLQVNLIRSHSAGVGTPLSNEMVRMLMALRINILAKGFSGITKKALEQAVAAFNKSCLPVVPEQGTVGASGDLAPLSHIALGLIGEGQMWSPLTGLSNAGEVLAANGLEPIVLQAKEGLALINGTQLITSLGAEAINRSIYLALQADIVAALTVEVLMGNVSQFDPAIHNARPHHGQKEVAARMRRILHSNAYPSQIFEGNINRRVQDAYTLRCIPQIHGVVVDTIKFCKDIIETEMNSATDNPMVLKERNGLISGGNFHGEYPAKALDYLAIGIQEIANVSERRTERLINGCYSGLPAFLVNQGGLNSGFMIAHCTAAALTSENKVLCHPSSSDTISTSGGTEDHVSMGGWSARKALKVIENVEVVVAVELLAACQALSLIHERNNRNSNAPLEAVYNLVRTFVEPWTRDRIMAPDIEAAKRLIQERRIWEVIQPFLAGQYAENEPLSRLF